MNPTDQLKALLSKHKLSTRKLAKLSGISKSHVQALLNGFPSPLWPKLAGAIRAGIAELEATTGEPVEFDPALLDRPGASAKPPEPNLLLLGGPTMLKQNVLTHFGLDRDPFTNEMRSRTDVWLPPQHRAALDEMLDAARHQKFIGIHGHVGAGKTVVKQYLFEQLAQEGKFAVSEPLLLEKTKCSPTSICDALIADLMYGFGEGVSPRGAMRVPSQLEAKQRFIKQLLKYKRDAGLRPVVVIDEAHDLPRESLKTLKRLHETQTGFSRMLSIILLGQPELRTNLADFRVREVTARINLVELRPIPNVVSEYVGFKLGQAGANGRALFSAAALQTLKSKLTLNSPLEINVVASKALQIGYDHNIEQVEAEHVEIAFIELQKNGRFEGQN